MCIDRRSRYCKYYVGLNRKTQFTENNQFIRMTQPLTTILEEFAATKGDDHKSIISSRVSIAVSEKIRSSPYIPLEIAPIYPNRSHLNFSAPTSA